MGFCIAYAVFRFRINNKYGCLSVCVCQRDFPSKNHN